MAAAKKRKPAKKTVAKKSATKKTTKARTRTKKPTKGAARRTAKVRVRGKAVAQSVAATVRNSKRKSVTYRKYKKGGAAIILRASNPTDQPKAVAAFVVGAIAGVGVSTLLDRWLATRASSQTSDKVLYGAGASGAIHTKSDGVRIFAQLAVGGLAAGGAYASRKKMPMLAVGLAGFAGAYLVKAGFMVMADHVLPMLFKSKKAGDAGDRYFPDRQPSATKAVGQGRRMMGGSPHPFGGKPARIGPVATGSVGGCASCGRSGVLETCKNCGGASGGCNCNPFPLDQKAACLRKVSGQTSHGCDGLCPNGGGGKEVPGDNGGGRIPKDPGNRIPRDPGDQIRIPRDPGDQIRIPRDPRLTDDGGGREVPGDNGGRETPGNGGGMPSLQITPQPKRIIKASNPFVATKIKPPSRGVYG